jgi:hypothetical protein
MSISLSCECGKKLAVKDELAGKKVKCPGCGSVLAVPAADSEAVTPAALPPLEEDDAPLPPRKKSTKFNSGKKKSNKMLWIGAAAGVMVLGFCCLGIAGGAAWWFLLRGGPEKAIIGKWTMDTDAASKSAKKDPMSIAAGAQIEFKSDGSVLDKTPMTPILIGKWKTISTKDSKNLTVELSEGSTTSKLEVTILDNDHLKITPQGMGEFYFKRQP